MNDYLGTLYPKIAARLTKLPIAQLPTPVTTHQVQVSGNRCDISVKHDELTNAECGGNKIRKLEYLLQRALERGARRVATFGAVGSNHALATAIHADKLGLACTCFLAHQKNTPYIPHTLAKHVALGTELLRYGGKVDRIALFRRYLQHRNTWVIPLGGSNWLGTLGFVNAALELAQQIERGDIEMPRRIYIANGTTGSAAGLAIGFALLELPIEIHAVRVASNQFSYPAVLKRLINKTALMLSRLDAAISEDLGERCRIVWREDFYAGGYAAIDAPTRNAVKFAAQQLGLQTDTTYTGKALAALLADAGNFDGPVMFWNTYSPAKQSIESNHDMLQQIPADFHRYLQA